MPGHKLSDADKELIIRYYWKRKEHHVAAFELGCLVATVEKYIEEYRTRFKQKRNSFGKDAR